MAYSPYSLAPNSLARAGPLHLCEQLLLDSVEEIGPEVAGMQQDLMLQGDLWKQEEGEGAKERPATKRGKDATISQTLPPPPHGRLNSARWGRALVPPESEGTVAC